MLAAFWSYAKAYYVDADGKPNTEAKNYRTLIKRLKAYCGPTPVSELRPLRLKALGQTLIDAKLARSNINHTINRMRRIIKWGVENEFVSSDVLGDLKCVAPLTRPE